MASALVEISNSPEVASDLDRARPDSRLSLNQNTRPRITVQHQDAVSPSSTRAGTEVSPRMPSQLEHPGEIMENNNVRYGRAPYKSQNNAFGHADEVITVPTDAPAGNNEQQHASFLAGVDDAQFEDPNRTFWQNQFLQDPFNAIGYPFLAATSLDPALDSMAFFLR